MQVYRIQTVVTQNGDITLQSLPFQPGQDVEVIVLSQSRPPKHQEVYPLRGKPVQYTNPFDGVAVDEWDALE